MTTPTTHAAGVAGSPPGRSAFIDLTYLVVVAPAVAIGAGLTAGALSGGMAGGVAMMAATPLSLIMLQALVLRHYLSGAPWWKSLGLMTGAAVLGGAVGMAMAVVLWL